MEVVSTSVLHLSNVAAEVSCVSEAVIEFNINVLQLNKVSKFTY